MSSMEKKEYSVNVNNEEGRKKVEQIIEEINSIKFVKLMDGQVDRDRDINLTISLIRAFFGNDINDGILASILFGEFAFDNVFVNVILNYFGNLKLEHDGNNNWHIVVDNNYPRINYSIMTYAGTHKEISLMNGNEMLHFEIIDDNQLKCGERGVWLTFDDDGLVQKRAMLNGYMSNNRNYGVPSYKVSRLIWVERDYEDISKVSGYDRFEVSRKDRILLTRESKPHGYVSGNALFDLSPDKALSKERPGDILETIAEDDSWLKIDSDISRFFPGIRKAIVSREVAFRYQRDTRRNKSGYTRRKKREENKGNNGE